MRAMHRLANAGESKGIDQKQPTPSAQTLDLSKKTRATYMICKFKEQT